MFANGLLNDVATCLWIKGRSHEELGQISEARRAYRQAMLLTHGRCWNEVEELFWSPAEKAGDDLANLEDGDAPTNFEADDAPDGLESRPALGVDSSPRQTARRVLTEVFSPEERSDRDEVP